MLPHICCMNSTCGQFLHIVIFSDKAGNDIKCLMPWNMCWDSVSNVAEVWCSFFLSTCTMWKSATLEVGGEPLLKPVFYYVSFCLCTLHMQCLQVSQWVYLFCNELHSAFSYNVVIYSNLAAHWGISSPMGLYAYSGATMFMQWSENQQCLNSCPAKRKDKHFHTFQKEREMGQHSTTRRHLTICAIVFYRTWCHCNFTVQQNTLSVRLRSQRPVSRNRRTMCVCPCSQAPISAVEPSRSWAFTSEPQLRSSFTMATRPWLTASMSAVWPAWRNSEE